MVDPSKIFSLSVPRSATGLMQHLQLLVGREGHRWWCAGVVSLEKLATFALKMAVRYPTTRTTRQRVHDRKLGLAVVHFVVFPEGDRVRWWLLSDDGRGGLADPASPDAKVAGDAMAADRHITLGDYVLLFATKKEPRELVDSKTGKPRRILKDLSTWTWKLRAEVVSEVRTGIKACCVGLEYGEEGSADRRAWGIRGLLAAQRSRPLFSGVRTQVLDFHRLARDAWAPCQPRWALTHASLAKRYGASAGALRPIDEVMHKHLPKMRRLKVYDKPPTLLGDLGRS